MCLLFTWKTNTRIFPSQNKLEQRTKEYNIIPNRIIYEIFE